jgi:hypothetical protein
VLIDIKTTTQKIINSVWNIGETYMYPVSGAMFDHNSDFMFAKIIRTVSRCDVQFMLHVRVVNINNMKTNILITVATSTN